MFDYDYTLDESGVKTDEKSNQQQQSNNLSKIAITACIAMAGYNMTLMFDPKKEVMSNDEAKSTSSTSTASICESPQKLSRRNTISSSTPQSYSDNALNIMANNQPLISHISCIEKMEKDRSSVGEKVDEEEVEREKNKNDFNSKYLITGKANNLVVKKILDTLVTTFIANKLNKKKKLFQVLKILTSNTRNPYLIWDNGCRAQLIDFLEDQRTASAREQYEDITDILNIASAFTLEAHK
jgi:DnaJ homolog subfamily C member 13